MKRIVQIESPAIRIRALIRTNGDLSRDEVDALCDDLAERLMLMLRDVPFHGVPISRIKVR